MLLDVGHHDDLVGRAAIGWWGWSAASSQCAWVFPSSPPCWNPLRRPISGGRVGRVSMATLEVGIGIVEVSGFAFDQEFRWSCNLVFEHLKWYSKIICTSLSTLLRGSCEAVLSSTVLAVLWLQNFPSCQLLKWTDHSWKLVTRINIECWFFLERGL